MSYNSHKNVMSSSIFPILQMIKKPGLREETFLSDVVTSNPSFWLGGWDAAGLESVSSLKMPIFKNQEIPTKSWVEQRAKSVNQRRLRAQKPRNRARDLQTVEMRAGMHAGRDGSFWANTWGSEAPHVHASLPRRGAGSQDLGRPIHSNVRLSTEAKQRHPLFTQVIAVMELLQHINWSALSWNSQQSWLSKSVRLLFLGALE